MIRFMFICLPLALMISCGKSTPQENQNNQNSSGENDSSGKGQETNNPGTSTNPTPNPNPPVTPPVVVNPPPPSNPPIAGAQRVFLSSIDYSSNLGGIAGGDQKCQSLARSAGLSGNWRAILSDTMTNARDRFSIPGRVVDMNKQLLASNASEFWSGSLRRPVQYNEKGSWMYVRIVWTGTNSNGMKNTFRYTTHCGNWTGVDGGVQAGRTDRSDYRWLGIYDPAVSQPSHACNNRSHIYCMESASSGLN